GALPNRLRKDRWDAHRGFRRDSAAELGTYAIRPCPTQDFNGAELLYFVSYPAFADRAEWDLLDLPAAGVATRDREVVFHGNLDPGERLSLTLRGVKRSPAGLGHWIQVSGAVDGRLLAEIFTMKAIAADR
ncbi:LnmK family bifunctional acyltransferase/decarboxylase, partial [Hansschlegelia zhihuaiae]